MNIFLGNYAKVLEAILEFERIDHIIFEEKKQSEEIIIIASNQKIPYTIVSNSKDIDLFAENKKFDLAVVASFGLILKNGFIKSCKKVINFHPGDIEIIRGRHPLPQTIINRLPDMAITAHIIDSEAIDAGPILGKIQIPINYSESYSVNNERLINILYLFAKIIFSDYFQMKYYARSFKSSEKNYYKPLDKKTIGNIINSIKINT